MLGRIIISSYYFSAYYLLGHPTAAMTNPPIQHLSERALLQINLPDTRYKVDVTC